MNQVIIPKRPSKQYLLLHDSRRGQSPHRFESRSDLASMLGLTVEEDLTEQHRDLLKFLGIVVEFGDYITIYAMPDTEGEWSKP